MHFGIGKSRDMTLRNVTRRVALVGQHGATRTARQARHAAEAQARRSLIISKQPSNYLVTNELFIVLARAIC